MTTRSRKEVTTTELREWRAFRKAGMYMRTIAAIYGYSESTIQFHLQPERLKEKRRAQWRARKKREWHEKKPCPSE